jgi:hypothetical protein
MAACSLLLPLCLVLRIQKAARALTLIHKVVLNEPKVIYDAQQSIVVIRKCPASSSYAKERITSL